MASCKNILKIGFFILGISLLNSCIRDGMTGDIDQQGKGKQDVTISISVPYPSTYTKALDKSDENMISTVDLLVFDLSDKYLYTSTGRDIQTDPTFTQKKNFHAVLLMGTVKIIMLANARDIVEDAFGGGIPAGTSLADIEKKLTLRIEEKWNTQSASSDFMDIPMWGNIGQVTIESYTTTLGDPQEYELYRMLAKIDVSTNLSNPSDFQLTSVHLYNRNRQSRLIPDANLMLGTPASPTLPETPEKVKGPLTYSGSAIANDSQGRPACLNEIYTFEAAAGSKAGHLENTCLVVGGIYQGVEGYYRIDFMNNNVAPAVYIPLVRNHSYNVIIKSVNDTGFKTPEEAFNAFPVDIEADIIDWNSNNLGGDMSIGSDYILKVSTDELIFTPEGGTKSMYIYTDHPDGWKFVRDNFVPEVSWLTLSAVKGLSNQYVEVKATIPAYTEDYPRSYQIPIVVDNIHKTVRFAQLGLGDIDLEVYATPNPMVFGKYVTSPIQLSVTTYPFNSPLYFIYTGDLEWEPGGFPTDGTTASTINLHPKPNTTSGILSGTLTIYIKDAYGHIASCDVELRQITTITGFSYTTSTYPGLAGDYMFRVTSTVPWRVDYVDNTAWAARFTGDQPAGPATDYTFHLDGNPTFQLRNFEVMVYSHETNEYTTIPFRQTYVNPSITASDGSTYANVYLPVENGQKVKFKFNKNVNWEIENTNIDYLSSSGGIELISHVPEVRYPGVPCDKEEVELEFLTKEPGTILSAKENRNIAQIVIYGYDFEPLAPIYQPRLVVDVCRTVLPVIRPAVYSGANHYASPATAAPNDSNRQYLVKPTKENIIFPEGEHKIDFKFDHNVAFVAYTSLDPAQRVTKSYSGSTIAVTQTVTLTIPENKTRQTRDFTLFIEVDGQVVETFPFKQFGSNVQVSISTPDNTVIPTGGMNITYVVTGNVERTIWMGVTIDNSSQPYNSPQIVNYASINAPGTYTFPVPANLDGKVRDIGVSFSQYHDPDVPSAQSFRMAGFLRSPIKTFKQNHASHTVPSTGRVIARGNLMLPNNGLSANAISTWVTAAGIEDIYLTTYLKNDYNVRNYVQRNDMGSSQYTCASYSEPDDGGKAWRLPLREELQYMYDNKDIIGGFELKGTNSISTFYHSIEEDDSDPKRIWTLSFSSGSWLVGMKTASTIHVARCVREP